MQSEFSGVPRGAKRHRPLALAAAALMVLSLLAGCATPSSPSASANAEADAASADRALNDLPDEAPASRGGTVGPATGISGSAWAALSAPGQASTTTSASGLPAKDVAWEVFRVPGKTSTDYSQINFNGRNVVQATADAAGSILRHHRRIEPAALGRVRFSWNVPSPGQLANQALPRLDDRPVRVVLAFEGDRSRFSMKNAMLSELSLMLTGEKMPFATLVYTWSRLHPAGEVIFNERTDRIRKLVVDSGEGRYDQWLAYERDIRADYLKAFGEEPGALLSIAVFTEGDRNDGPLQAFYGPLQLVPGSVVSASSTPP